MIRRFILLIILPILLYSSEKEVLQKANHLKVYEKNEWKSLLHFNNGLNITDKAFILSNDFSLKNELDTTISAFYLPAKSYTSINNHPQCRFPGRLLFISHELNVSNNEFPIINCPDFNTYKLKAPADKIFLTYASENVKNPSSMMGHTFLKYSGKNHLNKDVEHAITFYTILDSVNLFSLAYENIFSGMEGMFVLQPYKKIVEQYTDKENRNVWEYELKLPEYRKKLIYYHIWELKGIDMKYFFTSYNCSTVIYYTLSLTNPKIYDDKKLWITPLDTVKFLHKYNLVDNSELYPSSEWLTKMLEENLDGSQITNIKKIIKYKQYNQISDLDFYSLKLLVAYSELEYKKSHIDTDQYNRMSNKLNEELSSNKNVIDISKYKSPNKIPNERQLEIGYSNINKNEYMKLSFLGASHLLNDYNREYFGESELKIGYLSISVNKNSLELDELTLYGMKSYIPFDTLTNDLSYQFELSVKKEYTQSMDFLDTAKIDGGVGIDFLVAKDINVFFMLNGGIGYNTDDNAHLFFNPEIGGMIYEVLNMKSFISYQPLFIGVDKAYDKYTFKHNIFNNSGWKFSANIESIRAEKDFLNYEFSITKIF